ncbi:transglutaminase family protein [Aquibium oceanicum]|uniref:Transglutaminase n=1 Tax=Aquibium oceanicum TaxID=1670800 RepID=A0A1L3SUF7_9HYPH|nr:transglutaminase family protein [Aquibium oceanicum]APH73039.1 transglutaminase [Aquibium oceanicum]
MIYDVRLLQSYRYESPVAGGRHVIRVAPLTRPGEQRVVAVSLSFDPEPAERSDTTDFFGNQVSAITYRNAHDALDIRMSARVTVDRSPSDGSLSATLAELPRELERCLSLAADSPHHFLAASPLVALDAEIAAYAAAVTHGQSTAAGAAMAFCLGIHRDFSYDPKATDVRTPPRQAFRLRRGVCQDFSHVMISGLRSLGIPAGYVSGYLRTIPPPGRERLEGADAMHAWVKVWCGAEAGWLEFDPTNAIAAGSDHIAVGYGRDYSDVAPIIGVLRTIGSQEAEQSVDVIPLADPPGQ